MKILILMCCALLLGGVTMTPLVHAKSPPPPSVYCPGDRSDAGPEGPNRQVPPICASTFDFERCNEAKRSLQDTVLRSNFEKTGANAPKLLAQIGEAAAKMNVACAVGSKSYDPYQCSIRPADGLMICKGQDPRGPSQPDYTCKMIAPKKPLVRSDDPLTWECRRKHASYKCVNKGRDDGVLLCTGTDPKGPGKDVAPDHVCKEIRSKGKLLMWACKR